MKKSKIIVAILGILLCMVLTACTTVEIQVPAKLANAVLGGALDNIGNTGTDTDTAVTEAYTADDTVVTEAPVSDTATEAVPDATQGIISDTSTAAPATEAPATQAIATEAPATEVTTAGAASSSAPVSKEDIIKYYVTAYNKIATEAKTVTRTYDYTSNYKNILEINNNSTLEGIAGSLMTKFMVENKEPVVSNASDLPPVGVTTLSISPDKISSATCKDNGSTYEIVLKSTGTDSNYEVDSEAGKGSAGCIGPLLRTEDVTGAVGSVIKFEGLHSWYATASVKATVDKATGHITAFHFETPCILHFDKVTAAVVVKVENCNIGLLFTQEWTVAY